MTNNILKSRGKVYRLMNNKYQDECKDAYIDNYLGIILAIVIVSVVTSTVAVLMEVRDGIYGGK